MLKRQSVSALLSIQKLSWTYDRNRPKSCMLKHNRQARNGVNIIWDPHYPVLGSNRLEMVQRSYAMFVIGYSITRPSALRQWWKHSWAKDQAEACVLIKMELSQLNTRPNHHPTVPARVCILPLCSIPSIFPHTDSRSPPTPSESGSPVSW